MSNETSKEKEKNQIVPRLHPILSQRLGKDCNATENQADDNVENKA
jgi:hypothetical protein